MSAFTIKHLGQIKRMKRAATRAGGFQPGNKYSSGPKGRYSRFISQRLIAMMHEEVTVLIPDENDKNKDPAKRKQIAQRTQRLALLCEALFNLALEGDLQAIKYIIDRIEGTPIQTTVLAEEFDPDRMAAEKKRLDAARANLSNLSDGERTALYFQTLKQVTGTSGSSTPSH